jgi:hypothetical protein
MLRAPFCPTLLILAFAILLVGPAYAEQRCSDRVFSASGTPGRIHFSGRRNARLAWSTKVRAELGEAYASWGRSVSREFDCTLVNWRYRCTVTARPCKSIVPGRM